MRAGAAGEGRVGTPGCTWSSGDLKEVRLPGISLGPGGLLLECSVKAPPTQAGMAGIPLPFVTWAGEGAETQGYLGLLLLTAGSFWKH